MQAWHVRSMESYVALLEKYRHLIEPEISSGLTPVSWEQMIAMRPLVFHSGNSVVLTLDIQLHGEPARNIWVASGVMSEVMQLVAEVEKSSIATGIKSIVFMGRRGWIRAAKGYREMATIGIKEL